MRDSTPFVVCMTAVSRKCIRVCKVLVGSKLEHRFKPRLAAKPLEKQIVQVINYISYKNN